MYAARPTPERSETVKILDDTALFAYSNTAREGAQRLIAVLFKVYCYRGTDKQIWFEVEDYSTGQGVAWSPSRTTVVTKARKLGYVLEDENRPVLKFYRAKAS